ncbi:hypothetical protein GCM10023205_70980 [Yinghuangia aomiensis]|uniref:Uncharacterized protein n=1 Tax=Yinghuangia aomiensis TaxID=676205 RepID=A0ABP9I650_9ACTN
MGRPAGEYGDEGTRRISHEAIYQALFVQGAGAVKRELVACVPTGREHCRHPRFGRAAVAPCNVHRAPAEDRTASAELAREVLGRAVGTNSGEPASGSLVASHASCAAARRTR